MQAMAVQAVMMPDHYTAAMSIEDAALQARQMGVDYQVLPIEAMVSVTLAVAGSKTGGLSMASTSASNCLTGPASSSARRVGTIPRCARTNS